MLLKGLFLLVVRCLVLTTEPRNGRGPGVQLSTLMVLDPPRVKSRHVAGYSRRLLMLVLLVLLVLTLL